MDELDAYARWYDYVSIAAARGLRDPEEVAGRVLERICRKIKAGEEVTPAMERIVLSGQLVDALRRQRGEDERHPPAPARPLTLGQMEFGVSLGDALRGEGSVTRAQAEAWALVNINGLTTREAGTYLGVDHSVIVRANEACRLKLKQEVVV